jgi:hypothetical protein
MRWLRFLPRAKCDRERLRARVLVADRPARRKLSSRTRIREEICRNTIGFLDSVGRDRNEHPLSARESDCEAPQEYRRAGKRTAQIGNESSPSDN